MSEWVKVDSDHPLPDDLRIGDWVELDGERAPISQFPGNLVFVADRVTAFRRTAARTKLAQMGKDKG